ncbi:restriction endonuclease subunit S [Corynebacterium sanguinis]
MTWFETTLGEVLPFKYGKNLPATKRSHSGEFNVVTSAGVVDSHFEPLVTQPSVVIGRKGTIGSLTYCAEPCWPTDTTFFTTGSDACDVRFAYYFLQTVPLAEMNNDSAVPGLNRGEAEALPIRIHGLSEQKRIGDLLGSLDEKIAANSRTVEMALQLQSAVWQRSTENAELIPLVEVAEPILGGTPPRKDKASWNGGYKWASVADMTASPRSHLLNTADTISDVAARKKRFSPLPGGSVLLSARGTVGRVVSIVGPTSFNQSAYGFEAKPGFDAALRLAVMSAVKELRAKSYGSVFSTITKTQIQEALVPSVFNDHMQPLHQTLNALEALIVELEKENLTLIKTRDELLPLLMSGKITVREAEQEAATAGADIAGEESEA